LARLYYERVDDEGAHCLEIENSRRRAHTTMIAVFEAGPLGRPEGGVDFARIRDIVSARLAELPRLRTKLRRVPIEGHPVWVDDPEFKLDYHLQQSSLPRPGSHGQLCRTAARIAATPLDRSRPLWDCWILEGLEGGRFALVLKMHKALASFEGADLLRAILTVSPERADVIAGRFNPRPAPSPIELFAQEIIQAWKPTSRALLRARRLMRDPARVRREIEVQAKEWLRWLGYKLRPAGESPFDGPLGPHRSFAIHAVDFAAVQGIRRSLGGTVYDGILTILSGALRRFVEQRYISPVTVDLRAVTPILESDGLRAHNWTIDLPIWEAGAAERHGLVRDQTRRNRSEDHVASGEDLSATTQWNASRLFSVGARALTHLESGEIAILQAPGPQEPLHLDGARMVECYGILPLRDSCGLAITILSYAGSLFFAFNADSDIVPDLDRLQQALIDEVEEVLAVVAQHGPALRAVAGASGAS
jgi:WS/DGAT/MGAT family acyltransferase